MCTCIISDGYTYERSAIAGWMEKGKTTSPMTNGTLNTKQLTPNRSLKMLIQRYLQGQWLCPFSSCTGFKKKFNMDLVL